MDRHGMKAAVYESMRGLRAWLNDRLDSRWNDYPLGRAPLGTRDEYLALFEAARREEFPQMDALEDDLGQRVDRAWLDDVALHTQIVKKASQLAYPHGRLLYALLRHGIAANGWKDVTVLETGTARGFSALCMAKAMQDAGVHGRTVTVDVLPHLRPMFWNCVDDMAGEKTRAELLLPWEELTRHIVFLQGDTLYALPRLGLPRIHFAFLDAQHIRSSVMMEFETVQARQQRGDIVVFDDVTPAVFPGVVEAVDEIEAQGNYSVRRLAISSARAYAWAVRK